jgi:hypothetical protein
MESMIIIIHIFTHMSTYFLEYIRYGTFHTILYLIWRLSCCQVNQHDLRAVRIPCSCDCRLDRLLKSNIQRLALASATSGDEFYKASRGFNDV